MRCQQVWALPVPNPRDRLSPSRTTPEPTRRLRGQICGLGAATRNHRRSVRLVGVRPAACRRVLAEAERKVPPSHRGSERLAGVRHAPCRRVLMDAEKNPTTYAVRVASGRAVADMPYKRRVAGPQWSETPQSAAKINISAVS